MITAHIKNILRTARTKNNIGHILLNLEDFYDLVDSNYMSSRLDAVTTRALQEQGLYGHIDGFSIYCSKNCPTGQFALCVQNHAYVKSTEDLKWTDYQPFVIPEIGQRYASQSAPGFIVEVQGIQYQDDTSNYTCQFKILQIPFHDGNIWTYKLNEIISRNDIASFKYLIGQDKPTI